MTVSAIDLKIIELKKTYNVLHVLDLDPIHNLPFHQIDIWMQKHVLPIHQEVYANNDRLVFTLSRGDIYHSNNDIGKIVEFLYTYMKEIDISNFFVILLTTDTQFIPVACDLAQATISQDPVPLTHIACANTIVEKTFVKKDNSRYNYNSTTPLKIELKDLSQQEQYLLTESKTFCMYPWIHLHSYPTGHAHLCCHTEMKYPIGNCKNSTLEQIWNDTPIKTVRQQMLNNEPVSACTRCYEQEDSGFFSGRQSANKHHGHHINRAIATNHDGSIDEFRMTYWDIRFSNLCNLSCRSCGHIFSSSWYADQAKLAGGDWADRNTVLNYAGRTETDMWEQLIPHLDYVEQIYFAGGEPLMMKEHYNILDELERRGRFDVRLIYNTNFTHTRLKERTVFDYWKRFSSVAIGASLDAMGPRAEYIRKGTDWDTVERNREQMLATCPNVDFYISPTLSIMNAMHLPEFHRAWVEKGYIRPQDLNVNILQDPPYLRIDIAPDQYKQRVQATYQEHLEWLRPLDTLQRATVGFESAINFMMSTDNSALIPKFWSKTLELDQIRKENILAVIPELQTLQ